MNNAIAERAVLGAVMLGRAVSLRQARDAGCAAGLFADPRHRLYWSVFVDLDDAGEQIDPVTVSSMLIRRHQLEQAGGFPYLSALAGDCPCAANVASYVRALRDAVTLRTASAHARTLLEAANAPGADLGALLATMSKGVEEVERTSAVPTRGGFVNVAELMAEVAEEERQRAEGSLKPVPAMTPLSSLNNILTTWGQPGHRAGIAARPSMGKTLLALQICIFTALNRGRTAFISRESPPKAIVRRIWKMESAQGGRMQAQRMLSRLDGRLFIIGPQDAKTIIDARSALRDEHARSPFVCVAADYLQKFDKHTDRGREDLDLGEISAVWADLIEELDCLGIMLAQLNRKVTDRTDKAPQLSDIRECGAFEQDCDSMLMLHRPGYYTGNEGDRTASGFVRKHRDGAVGRADMEFVPGQWFRDAQPTF